MKQKKIIGQLGYGHLLLGHLVESWNNFDVVEEDFKVIVSKDYFSEDSMKFALEQLKNITDSYTRFYFTEDDDFFEIKVQLII